MRCEDAPKHRGGNSQFLTVEKAVWNTTSPTVSRRSTDGQSLRRPSVTHLSKALKYAAVLLMVFMVGIGNAWGTDRTFTVEGPAVSKRYMQDKILVSGTINASKKIANGSNGPVFYLQNGNYAPLQIVSKSANIKKIEIYGNRDTGSNSQATAFNVQTSSDAISFSVPTTGFTAKATNNSTETNVNSLSGVTMIGNNQTYATTVTVTFTSPVMAVRLVGTASVSIKSVAITYDDAISPTTELCEVHMTSATALSSSGTGSFVKTAIKSGSTLSDTESTPNTYYYNKSDGTYGYFDLGSGKTFQAGDEIWIDMMTTSLKPGTDARLIYKLNNSNSASGSVSVNPNCSIAAYMPTLVRYITKSTDPWVGQQTLYILRNDGNNSLYQVTIHRAGGSGGGDPTPSTYSVTYDGNGNTSGDVPTDSDSPYEEGDEVTVLGNTNSLARTGYTFSGWNTEADGTGDSYAASETFDMGTANVTLYAKWTLNLSTHSAGTYETAAGSGGYGLTLKTYSGRDYEIYTFNTSKLYAGSSVTSSDGKEMLTAVANKDVAPSDTWLLVRPSAVNDGGNSDSPDQFAFTSETANDRKTHYVSIKNTDYIKLKVSGYDQFTFFGRDNGTSDGKKFVVKIDGVAQTFDHSDTDNTLYPFTLTTETHLIEVTADGTNACRFRGFSLRIPEPPCDVTAPGDISKGALTDGTITLTADGSPAENNVWYWQSSASGTDKTGTSGASKTVSAAGTYYLRSYHTVDDCWSDAESYELTAADFIAHYAITYNKGTYGTGSIDAGDKTEDVTFTLSSQMFTRDGYVQVGWATTDGGTKAYDLGGSYTANAAQTFYPVWAPKETYSFAVANEKTITTLKSEGWTFNSDEFDADPADSECYVNTVGAMNTAGLSSPHSSSMNDNAIAFAKNTDAYALFDLGYVTTVSSVTGSFNIGSTKDRKFYIEYIGSNGSTVLKTVTVEHNKTDWGANAVNETTAVANVRYIKVNSVEEKSWLVMTAFSVTYGDVTPKYTVTYALNGGSGTTPTETDKKAGAVFTLHNGTTSITAPENKEFDGWLCSANSTKYAGGAEYTMTAANTTFTAQWKAIATKYAMTYVLNGPTGDAPTETNKAEDEEFDLAAAPTWADHVFEGWQWTDGEEVTHLEDAEAEFTMPAYAVTFTAQWKLDPQATMSNAQYVIGGSALNMAAKFSSLNTSGAVIFSLKESYEGAEITPAGSFTATVAGEYIVVAEQAGDGTYANGSAEATVEVLESEAEDIFIFNKNSSYGGNGKCLTADQANTDDGAHKYVDIVYEGFTGMGRAGADNTECILTFSVKSAYSSLFSIKDICTYGKFEEPLGGQISWDGGTNWEDLAKYSEGKKVFEAPGTFPTSFKIKFLGVSKSTGGLWWRNALVTLERKKEIKNTVIDLTDVKINNSSISAANLATLKTADAYALELADEYVTAPTVKFNKHTVITYEDDSEVEKDDVISKTATVNLSGEWEASAEINEITYTVTMEKADAFVVHYYQADGETLIGSENVAVSGHPTAAGITPTPQDYKRVVWKLSGEPVDLEDVTSDVAGTEITLVASYVDAYARSINIEQWVLDNSKNNSAFRAVLDSRYYKYANLNDLDSLTADKNEGDRNYPFLGQKWKLATSEISFLLKEGSTVKVRFGNMGNNVNVIIGEADPIELTSGSYANTSVSSAKEYSYTATEDVVVKFQGTGTGTVVFKQIMIDEAIATVKLPAIVTYDANGGSFGKTSEKYTGTPLVIADATPADEDYEFEGWHLGTVEGEKINAAAYEPTKNVTLVAKYVVKPSPFSLSALTYQIGTGAATAVGYEEGTYEYDVELPYAGSYETITVAYTLADGTSSTKAGAVLDVTSVPGAATFTVIAANETEKTYTVNFTKDAKDGLNIIKATISGGNETAGFDATGLYAGKGYAQTVSKKLNTGGAFVGVQLKAGEAFQAGDKLYVVTSTDADRGYIELYREAAGTNLIKATGVRDASAGIVIPSEAYGLNEIYIVRKTSEGDQSWNGTVNYVEVTRPMNPVLKSITFDGTKINVASTTVEETLPYATDLTAVTPEIFWNGAGTAVVTTNEGAWAWGENTYVLTDKDGDATPYTITLVRAERSSDKTLSSLTVDGNAIALDEGVYNYTYVYPYGTDPATVPAVAAVANDAHASVGTITQAGSTTGTASFTVTAEDESEQEYTVKFQISRVPGLVIYDGSTMTDIAAKTGSDPTGFSWSMGSNVDSDGSNVAGTWQDKNYEHAIKGFKANANASNIVSFTVPSGYLAKIRLVGSTNSDGDDRKMFIANEATNDASKALGNYVITSSTYEAQGFVTELLMPGTYYLGSTDSYRLFELSAQLYPIDYSRDVTDGRLGTICLQKGGTMVGAAVYEVAYFNPDNRKIYFDEVLNGEMVPGMPYVFLPDQGNNDQMVVTYGNNAAAAEAGHQNGLYGSFTEQLLTRDADNYILQSNKYWYVNSDEVYVGENRAYLKVQEIYGYQGQPEPAPAHGRRRVMMDAGAQAPNMATGMEDIQGGAVQSAKVLIDGKMYILRGEKMYDATGRLVK